MDMKLDGELLESTYRFCLKHVSDPNDAEDLTQEILLEALAARGKKIDSFYAWFWQMARNKISAFYRMKKNGALLIDEFVDIPSSEPELDSELLKAEEISELNYHISRLSHLHRSVIIMYYLQKMSVEEIARQLDVPEGTVKRRLFDARKDIKKGFEEMNNYGRSSYAPAQVGMWGGYGIPDYWNNISDQMTKQIFVCCGNESKSIKEIADEIGCAPVYFEEKLQYLVDNKFLKETTNGKYITDFCVLPASVWNNNGYEVAKVYSELGREVTELIKENERKFREFEFYGNDMPFGELLWYLYFVFSDALEIKMKEKNSPRWKDKVPADNGKGYRICCSYILPDENYEPKETETPKASWSNLHKTFSTTNYKWVMYGNIFECKPFGDRDNVFGEGNIDLFMRLFDNPKLELTETEKYKVAEFIKRGYLKEKDGGLYPTMPIVPWRINREITNLAIEFCDEVAEKYVDKINKISEETLLPYIRKDLLEEYVNWVLPGNFFTIQYLYGYAMSDNTSDLAIPEDYDNTSLATYLTYNI